MRMQSQLFTERIYDSFASKLPLELSLGRCHRRYPHHPFADLY